MIYDNLMNAGSLPSRAVSPSAPMDRERSGRIVSRSSEAKSDRKDSDVKVTYRDGVVMVTASSG